MAARLTCDECGASIKLCDNLRHCFACGAKLRDDADDESDIVEEEEEEEDE